MYSYGGRHYGPTTQPPPDPEDLYDLLDAIVLRTPWASEAEVKRYRLLVEKIRRINLFGYLAKTTTTQGDDDEQR